MRSKEKSKLLQAKSTSKRKTRLKSPSNKSSSREELHLSVPVFQHHSSNSLGTTFVVEDKYEYIKQIGHGAYGVVCSAYDHKSKQKVAIKKVPKAFEDLIDAKRIVREIKLLSKILIIDCCRILRTRQCDCTHRCSEATCSHRLRRHLHRDRLNGDRHA